MINNDGLKSLYYRKFPIEKTKITNMNFRSLYPEQTRIIPVELSTITLEKMSRMLWKPKII